MLKGINLYELIAPLDAEFAYDVIDSLVVDEMLAGAEVEGGLEKVRTNILSVYNGSKNEGSSNDAAGESNSRDPQPIKWTEQTEDGFVGLEAPFG